MRLERIGLTKKGVTLKNKRSSLDALSHISASQLRDLTPWAALVDAIRDSFCQSCHMPLRHHHTVTVPAKDDATLLLMPAWTEGNYLGVKIAQVFPSNRDAGLPSLSAIYLLSSAIDGQLLAVMDGEEITARRTAAASVLAAQYLAPKKARRHLMVGTGRLSPYVVEAYAQMFGLESFSLWGRNLERCRAGAAAIEALGIPISVVAPAELDKAVTQADIISCATLSHRPLIKGALLKPGTHVDLIGGFTPAMREADDDVIKKSSIFVDTYQGATQESGDIVIPMQNGLLTKSALQADLSELCSHRHPGRRQDSDITVFKSVGAACEDLAAAVLAYQSLSLGLSESR